jgi:hypothetical protein
MDSEGIRQIFWCEIWAPLSSAKRHDNSRIVALFLDSLFEEALFDDEGAWIVAKAGSLQLPRPQNTKECPGSSLLH